MRVVSRNVASFAFTLAEVLITLMVIGILAALTIPTLLQNMQKQELKTVFKKTYSDIAQATQKIMKDNGGTMLGICTDTNYNCLKDKYAAHLNVVKSCDYNTSFGNCWVTVDNFKYLSGSNFAWANYPALVLNNGSFVRITMIDDACKYITNSSKGECGFISIDVNGFKKPNTAGKDVFWIHIYENGIAPWGVSDDDSNPNSKSTTCSKNSTGQGCAALVLQDIDY